jgi:hypothetical protein
MLTLNRLATHATPEGYPPRARASTVSAETAPGDDLSSADITLLLHHASYGCIGVICTAAKRRYPFVFLRRLREWKSTRAPVSFALPPCAPGVLPQS